MWLTSDAKIAGCRYGFFSFLGFDLELSRAEAPVPRLALRYSALMRILLLKGLCVILIFKYFKDANLFCI